MTRQCGCCGGRCGESQPIELNRRGFLGQLAAGTTAWGLAEAWASAEPLPAALPLALPKAGPWPAYPLTPPRVYRGRHLEAVGMPIGGIGTGGVWLDGQGRLSVWQIFNNLNETGIPDSFFAVQRPPRGRPGRHASAPDHGRRTA